MAEPSLDSIYVKLELAEANLGRLDDELTSYYECGAYEVFRAERDGEWQLFRLRIHEPLPARWAAQVGDVANALRSALNYLIRQLVLLNGETPDDRNQFPIYTKRPENSQQRKQYKRMVKGLSAAHDGRVFWEQPYQTWFTSRPEEIEDESTPIGRALRTQRLLALLQLLSNTDRHEDLAPLLFYSAVPEAPSVEHVGEVRVETRYTQEPLSDGSELFRIKVEPPSADIAVSGESTFVVTFGRAGPIWELEAMLEAVRHIVGLFEPDFAVGTGSPAAPADP